MSQRTVDGADKGSVLEGAAVLDISEEKHSAHSGYSDKGDAQVNTNESTGIYISGEKTSLWKSGEPRKYSVQQDISWKKAREMIEKYDQAMCSAWKDDIDQILLFAGLFSATVTSFTVESYQWLSKSPEDSSTELLAFIATQLSPGVALPDSLVVEPFEVSAVDVHINVLWFLSLALSVSTVFVGILCLQWLTKYQRDPGLPHKDAVALRQMRFEGLLFWQIPNIIGLLPILLLTALILFFIGLLLLLWTKNSTVAIPATCIIACSLLFIAVTSLLPTLQLLFVSMGSKFTGSTSPIQVAAFLCHLQSRILFRRNTGQSNKDAEHEGWAGYDMRWRRARDAVSFRWKIPEQTEDGADLIHAAQWLSLNLNMAQGHDNLDALYPAYSFLLSDYDASLKHDIKRALRMKLSATESYDRLNKGLTVMFRDISGVDDAGQRDILLCAFLHLHKDGHPELKKSYVESLIRVLNSLQRPGPLFCKWLGEVVFELNGNVNSVDLIRRPSVFENQARTGLSTLWSCNPVQSVLNKDLIVQLSLCIGNLLANDHLEGLVVDGDQHSDSSLATPWNLLSYLFNMTRAEEDAEERGGSEGTVSALSWNLDVGLKVVDNLHLWLNRSSGGQYHNGRVRFCVKAVLRLLPLTYLKPRLVEASLTFPVPDNKPNRSTSPERTTTPSSDPWAILVRFIRGLDIFVIEMGGHNLFDIADSHEKWRALMASVGRG
ncbi:hypothetical protein FA15DRAFT_752367 [Coprinopsis marcescibilis]|uniref:DUF6535 domain-containing protein n=1 Tax=Coprinopsis marcescibilis TaxID=230819 RepID=A0A5C3LB57_COPMA|nr:hypothetical protein FA15DRAFT_752367 [Coprinopsis marcescibilis]